MDWREVQRELWKKWKTDDPALSDSDLWNKYKHEWVEAYRPFVKDREKVWWLISQ